MPLGLRSAGAIGRSRADPAKHFPGERVDQPSHEAVERMPQLCARDWRQDHLSAVRASFFWLRVTFGFASRPTLSQFFDAGVMVPNKPSVSSLGPAVK